MLSLIASKASAWMRASRPISSSIARQVTQAIRAIVAAEDARITR